MKFGALILVAGFFAASCQQKFGIDVSQHLQPAPVGTGGSADVPTLSATPTSDIVSVKEEIFQGGSAGADRCNSVTVDSERNVYCVGTSGLEGFLLKMSPSGTTIWNTSLGKFGLNRVVVDSARKSVFAVGATEGSIGEANAMSGGQATWDALVVKLNSTSGSVVWKKQFGAITKLHNLLNANQGWDVFTSAAVDSDGNVVAGGFTKGNMGEVNGFTPPPLGYASKDLVLAKLDPNGELLWIRQMGAVTKVPGVANANAGNDACNSIAVDAQNNIFCGGAGQTLSEANGALATSATLSSHAEDAFVAKFDPAGNLKWIRQFGAGTRGSADTGIFAGNDVCRTLAIDKSGAIYCGGISAGQFAEKNGNPGDPSSYEAIFFKLNPDGVPIWKAQFRSATKAPNDPLAINGLDMISGIALSADEKTLFASGQTSGDFGDTNASDAYQYDALVMKVNALSGSLIKIKQLGTEAAKTSSVTNAYKGNDWCLSGALDPSGIFYCAGSTLGNMGAQNLGSFDYFIWKIGADF